MIAYQRTVPDLETVFFYSSIAQSVERAAVNRVVVGSSPTRGVQKLARWLSWLERRPVTAEVEGSNPFRVVTCEYPSTHDASVY